MVARSDCEIAAAIESVSTVNRLGRVRFAELLGKKKRAKPPTVPKKARQVKRTGQSHDDKETKRAKRTAPLKKINQAKDIEEVKEVKQVKKSKAKAKKPVKVSQPTTSLKTTLTGAFMTV